MAVGIASAIPGGAAFLSDAQRAIEEARGGAENGNFEIVKDRYLKENGIDAHQLKRDNLGQKAPISEYDIYKNKDTGELFIFKKGGGGAGIATGEFIK